MTIEYYKLLKSFIQNQEYSDITCFTLFTLSGSKKTANANLHLSPFLTDQWFSNFKYKHTSF